MAYGFDNALFQWEEGERRVRELSEADRMRHERAAGRVAGELRRRLGSSFTVEELAALYGGGVDWAGDIASRHSAGADSAWVVDAAFGRYAREATDFAGGRPRGRSLG